MAQRVRSMKTRAVFDFALHPRGKLADGFVRVLLTTAEDAVGMVERNSPSSPSRLRAHQAARLRKCSGGAMGRLDAATVRKVGRAPDSTRSMRDDVHVHDTRRHSGDIVPDSFQDLRVRQQLSIGVREEQQ